MDCKCGKASSASFVLASIYEMKISDDTRLLLCLGALISHHHVLTSKNCFGPTESDRRNTVNIFKCFYIVQVTTSSLKILFKNHESYPYISDPGAFPHSITLNVNKEKLDDKFILIHDVAEIKKSPHDDFCILTMKKYVHFKFVTFSPLCLPENPNQFYDKVESKAKIYGFGYDITFEQTVKEIAKMERDQNKMLKTSRTHKTLDLGSIGSQVLSRRKCLQLFGKHGDRLEGKGGPGPEDIELKV